MNAEDFLDEVIPESHWLDDVWRVPGAPRMVVHLDNAEMLSSDFDFTALLMGSGKDESQQAAGARLGYVTHITRVGYMASVLFRAERGRIDLRRPLRAHEKRIGRHPINMGHMKRCFQSLFYERRVRDVPHPGRASFISCISDVIFMGSSLYELVFLFATLDYHSLISHKRVTIRIPDVVKYHVNS
ncbi:hypothetical protein EJ02DRAFT_476488 [Clathrospora elynae]|uniref:Uncharacterized protein n=1 Tax=Clathrospora elynae TaxID=706981 RepID=A0A6A5SZ98_9PLEO|nr:hypothetical protein EJ02DRAFT_476488 [Clathrospora elynae]